MQQLKSAVVLAALALLAAGPAAAVDRNPTGVNVDARGATSVFITFGNLVRQRPAEAQWCGELIPATPDIGQKCAPGTIFGRLPARLDQVRESGTTSITDIMSIPASVTRRAFQAAEAGAESRFFYVRRFESLTGGPDEYVTVTCRMASGGARTPFSLTDVRLTSDVAAPILVIRTGGAVPPIRAEISYTGTGWLRGRWEVVQPGDQPPTPFDLLPEASLPVDQRPRQRRYTQVARFRELLAPGGSAVLDGPPADALPTDVEGVYQVLLRVEATIDKESTSDLAAAGAGSGVVFAGGVAGFPLPTFRYVVGRSRSDLALADAFGNLQAIAPEPDAAVDAGGGLTFVWSGDPRAASYLLEIEDARGERVLGSILRAGGSTYTAPPWLADRSGEALSWRVTALDADDQPVGRTAWRRFELRPGGA